MADEHTPLLPPTSRPRHRPTPRTHTGLITLASLLLPLVLLAALLVNSFIPSDADTQHIAHSALLYDDAGPQVGLLNFSSGYTSAWIELSGRVGVDVDVVLGIGGAARQQTRGHGARWWEALRAHVGRKSLSLVGPLVVTLPDKITVFPQSGTSSSVDDDTNDDSNALITVSLPTPIDIPLIDLPSAKRHLPQQTYHSQLNISRPTRLLAFSHSAWRHGAAHITIRIPRVVVSPRNTSGWLVRWRKWLTVEQKDVLIHQRVDVADLPGVPRPDDDLAEYIVLESYALHTTTHPHGDNEIDDKNATYGGGGGKQLRVAAVASARNPFAATVGLRPFTVPLELGFGIFLPVNLTNATTSPDSAGAGLLDVDGGGGGGGDGGAKRGQQRLVKMAEVVTMPFSLHGQERVRIHVEGIVKTGTGDGQRTVDDGGGEEEDSDSAALSTFLNNYLQGRPNNVTILGLPYFPVDASPDAWTNSTQHPGGGRNSNSSSSSSSVIPPEWIQRMLSDHIRVVVPFPAPVPSRRPKLIQSVTIEQMKISERAGKMHASGIVVVRASLPPDLADIEVSIQGVLPDVLISDGKMDDDDDGDGDGNGKDSVEVDPTKPPYPPRAFGRIHPPAFLPAVSSPSPDDPTTVIVRAPLHDVPLDILPGRDKVLSDFVGKLVFKGSAQAGIGGNAAVKVDVVGVGRMIEVRHLPVSGVVVVGRPRVV